MTCPHCKNQDWFWKKIGRCQRCMNQLSLLSVAGWGIWWLGFRDSPKSIESITLLLASTAFTGLLALHLAMRFFVIPLQSTQKRRK